MHGQECETFALGKSGDPFSQYLAYAEFAILEFNPDNLIFSIISNDYDESLLKYNSIPTRHYFNDSGELERVDFQPSLLGLIVRSSSFLYYLHNDLKIHVIIQEIVKKLTNDRSTYDFNERLAERETDAVWAVDIFLEKIGEMAQQRKVILVVDGDRNGVYHGIENRDESRALGRLNKYLIQKSKYYDNVVVIDMQRYFWDDWTVNKKAFNSQQDYHWNAYGHFVVAKTIHCYLQEILCNSKQQF